MAHKVHVIPAPIRARALKASNILDDLLGHLWRRSVEIFHTVCLAIVIHGIKQMIKCVNEN